MSTITVNYSRLKDAKDIESILCLSVLIASGAIPANSTIQDAIDFYENLKSGCVFCPYMFKCLACIINE